MTATEVTPWLKMMACEPWQVQFDDIMSDFESDGDFVESDLGKLLEKLVRPQEGTATASPAEVAALTDQYYLDPWLPANPLTRRASNRALPGFLTALSNVTMMLAQIIPYEDPKQMVLAQYVAELRRLPARQMVYCNYQYSVYVEDPFFTVAFSNRWTSDLGDWMEDMDYELLEPVRRGLRTNTVTFLARCISLIDTVPVGWWRFPYFDLRDALEKLLPAGKTRTCHVWVATQWILAGGNVLSDWFILKDKGFNEQKPIGPERWLQFARTLEQYLEQEQPGTPLALQMQNAHLGMIASYNRNVRL
jgi:hypothetical protein